MDDGDRRVPEMRPAMQAASKARQQVLDAAEHARGSRRPPASPQEIALPLVNAVSYLVDAVIEQQNQLERVQDLAEKNATALIAMAEFVDGHIGGLMETDTHIYRLLQDSMRPVPPV